jgi:hypothetical protein
VFGGGHPSTLMTVNNLALALTSQGMSEEALSLFKRTCIGFTKALGEEHPYTRMCRKNYTHVLASQRRVHSADVSEVIVLDIGENTCRSKESCHIP